MISLVELRTRGHPMMSGVQTPSQCPDTGQPPERWACNLLRTKHFHGVSSRNQPPYLLKSRYGKVSIRVYLSTEKNMVPNKGRVAMLLEPVLASSIQNGYFLEYL